MNKLRRIASVCMTAVALLLLASCASPKKFVYLNDMEPGKQYPVNTETVTIVHENDRLDIKVSCKNPELAVPFNSQVGAYKMSVDGGVSAAGGETLEKGYRVDADGNIIEIKCTYDPTTKPGGGEWRSVKGTIHWVSAAHAKELELRLYDKLFTEAQMGQIPEGEDYKAYLNPESLVIGKGYAEPALLEDNSGIAVQFERVGYFFKDPDSTPDNFVFNKTTALKDSFKF